MIPRCLGSPVIAAICLENRDLRNEAAIYTAVKQIPLQ
jgi:hypothetical protein